MIHSKRNGPTDQMRRCTLISLLSGAAVCPLVAAAQLATPPTQTTTVTPRIELVRVKPIDPAVPKLHFQLNDGPVGLIKAFSLGGFEGVGAAWKMPPNDETFDARYGRW